MQLARRGAGCFKPWDVTNAFESGRDERTVGKLSSRRVWWCAWMRRGRRIESGGGVRATGVVQIACTTLELSFSKPMRLDGVIFVLSGAERAVESSAAHPSRPDPCGTPPADPKTKGGTTSREQVVVGARKRAQLPNHLELRVEEHTVVKPLQRRIVSCQSGWERVTKSGGASGR